MKELVPYKSYMIPDDGFNIYLFALGKTWVAIKYGKDDYVGTRGTWAMRDDLLKKEGIKRLSFKDSGFNGIGQYIIKQLFEGKLAEQVNMIGK